ncbi:MAG: PAS domain-containing protein, partial [Alphaproteobacteria bacterium]
MRKGSSKDEGSGYFSPSSGGGAGSAAPIEALLATVFDSQNTALFLHDAVFRIVYANPAYAKLAGQPREAVLGQPYWEVFPPHDGPLAGCQQGTRDRGIRNETVDGPDGRVFRMEHLPFPALGEVDAYSLHILIDISAQQSVGRRARILDQALAQTAEAVVLLDPQFHVLEVNQQYCDWIGLSRQELLGQPWLASGGVDSAFVSETVLAQLEASAPWREEIELHSRSGPPLPVLATGNAVRDEDGTILAYVFNFSDLRKLHEAHKAREILLEVIQALSELSSLAEAGELAIQKAVELVGGDVGGIAVNEPAQAQLCYHWLYGLQETPQALFVSFRPGEGLAGKAILSGETEIQNDYQ